MTEATSTGRVIPTIVEMFRFLLDTPAFLVFEVRPRKEAVAALEYFNRRVAPKL